MLCIFFFFFFNDTATTEIYTLSLHDALPISLRGRIGGGAGLQLLQGGLGAVVSLGEPAVSNTVLDQGREMLRSGEHTSELPSPCNLVCRLLLVKKKKKKHKSVAASPLSLHSD